MVRTSYPFSIRWIAKEGADERVSARGLEGGFRAPSLQEGQGEWDAELVHYSRRASLSDLSLARRAGEALSSCSKRPTSRTSVKPSRPRCLPVRSNDIPPHRLPR